MSRLAVRVPVSRYRAGTFGHREDEVTGEEPLEIRIGGAALSVTMRTPGHDIDLVHGLLHSEGIIERASDIDTIRYCDGVDEQGRNTYNVLDVALHRPRPVVPRTFTTTSACGVCGSASIDALTARRRFATPDGPVFDPELLLRLPELLRENQRTFAATGGLHAAALVTPAGDLRSVREDIGRHNAVDKVIGAAIRADELPLAGLALLTSSRASFELVQKALLAGIGTLIAVSAPSSLAVELAVEAGMTLVAFAREDGFNLYSGPHRVAGAAQLAPR